MTHQVSQTKYTYFRHMKLQDPIGGGTAMIMLLLLLVVMLVVGLGQKHVLYSRQKPEKNLCCSER